MNNNQGILKELSVALCKTCYLAQTRVAVLLHPWVQRFVKKQDDCVKAALLLLSV